MSVVKYKESVERVGDASVSTIEYEFSDSVDFLAWESDKQERLNKAFKSLYATESPYHPEQDQFEESAKPFIKVSKKETKH